MSAVQQVLLTGIAGGVLSQRASLSGLPVYLASSADGSRMVACNTYGAILGSFNGGDTFVNLTYATIGNQSWSGMAASSNAQIIVAVTVSGTVFRSSDGGITWSNLGALLPSGVSGLASSADGNKLVACAAGGAAGYIYTSTDGGTTWVQRTSAGYTNWVSVASSSDGTRLVACTSNGGVYKSVDSGASWAFCFQAPNASEVASSSDGMRLFVPTLSAGGVAIFYRSVDGGGTWVGGNSVGTITQGIAIAVCDGSKVVAAGYNDSLYISNNNGDTWSKQPGTGSSPWYAIAANADGSKLLAADGSYLYTYS